MDAFKRLRRHGAAWDTFSGAVLPIRLEAMRMECEGPFREELMWRVALLDEVLVEKSQVKQDARVQDQH